MCSKTLHVFLYIYIKMLPIMYPVSYCSRGWLLLCGVYVLFFKSWAAWPWRLSSRAYLPLLNRDCFPICCLIISPVQMSHIQPSVAFNTLDKTFTLTVGGKEKKNAFPPAHELGNSHVYGAGKTNFNSMSCIMEQIWLCCMVMFSKKTPNGLLGLWLLSLTLI